MKKITICDRTLCREGGFGFKEKIEMIRQLNNLKVDVIELPEIENVKTDTLFVRTASSFVKNSRISVEIGETKAGVESAAAALSGTALPRMRLSLPVSPTGMEYTCHKKPDGMIEMITAQIAFAKEKCDDIEFCALDATRAEKKFLTDAIKAAVAAGATSVTVCDNVATGLPDDFAAFVAGLLAEIPELKNVPLGVLCEDKNGMSGSATIMAVKAGAASVKVAVGGSVVSTDAFAGIIKNCGASGGFGANIKFTQLSRIVKQIAWIISGSEERTATPSGGVEDANVRLDANDNQDAVATEVKRLGYDLSADDIAKVYEEFKRVATKKNVGAKELDAIVASVALQVPPTYKLISYVVNTGNVITASAQIKLQKDDVELAGVCMGDGPIDAAFLAIEQIVEKHFELDDFQIHSITEGKEAVATAVVKLRQGGKLYSGNGVSTDIIGASIRAYVNALNKIVYNERNEDA